MSEQTLQLILDNLVPLLKGTITGTIPLTLISFVLGLAVALVVALMRLSPVRAVSGAARAYVSVIRGTPLLLQLFIIFYGLPALGVTFDPFPAAVIAFTLNVGGYAAEVIRSAILAVPKGQWEAARSTGLGFARTLRYVVLPQAIRLTIPPLTNRTIAITKGTALASVVAVQEILGAAQAGVSFSFNPTPLTLGALAYLVLFVPVVIFGRWVETRFAWRR